MTPKTAEQLLRFVRLERFEELGRAAATVPALDLAISRMPEAQGADMTPRQRGRLARTLIERAIQSLTADPAKSGEGSARSYILLNSFYLHRATRRDTLVALHMGGGSFDRIKAQALQHLGDALEVVCARTASDAPSPGNSPTAAPPLALEPSDWFSPPAVRGANLPARPYRKLWGRERELGEILGFLAEGEGPGVAGISGLGGNGKTALAREVVERLVPAGFTDILWVSAQRQVMVGSHPQPTARGPVDLARLINDILGQMSLGDWTRLPLESQLQRLAALWRTYPYLVVLDNLDESEQEVEIVRQLADLVGRGKLIVTSRHSRMDELPLVRPFHLAGLDVQATLNYLRQEGAFRGLDLSGVADGVLAQVHQFTGGAPLALNLIIGQAQTLALRTVLDGLIYARAQMQDLYTYLFWQDWVGLEEDAQKVLIYLGRMIATSVSEAQLRHINLVPEVEKPLEQLVRLSLIETNVGVSQEEKRYSLHPLVRNFVQSDLPRVWKSRQA